MFNPSIWNYPAGTKEVICPTNSFHAPQKMILPETIHFLLETSFSCPLQLIKGFHFVQLLGAPSHLLNGMLLGTWTVEKRQFDPQMYSVQFCVVILSLWRWGHAHVPGGDGPGLDWESVLSRNKEHHLLCQAVWTNPGSAPIQPHEPERIISPPLSVVLLTVKWEG